MNLKNGTRLGPYEIVAPIGAGGMGEVYRGRDTRLGRTVAIKILPSEFSHDARLKIRFAREAKAISALNHPHICTLYDVGDSYLVMEYCEGQTLAQRVADGPLPLGEALQYGIEIADALDNAHGQGIIHRDLKPSNIMLSSGGVKLLDFGLAKQEQLFSSDTSSTAELLTEEGSIIGTIQYIAPEVLRGQAADARGDIFALGLILYEMLAGKRAFDGSSKATVIAAILEREPTPVMELNANTPPALDLLIRACLEKNPEERIQTANDVRLQLRFISEGSRLPLSPRARLYASTSGAHPPRRRTAAVALAVLVAIAGAGWWAWREHGVAAVAPIRSLVVLPFENMSKPDDEYLVTGMHDGVIGQLSQISAWRLISRTSANHYKKTTKSIPEIARELNIDAVVEGSVLRAGNDLRLQVTLFRARPEERQIWSNTYERGLQSVLAIQKDVARAIASASSVALTRAEMARLSRPRQVKPETYEAYTKGMFHIRKLKPEDVKKGLEYLTKAAASDPNDPFVHAGLALAYSIIGHGPSPTPDAFILAKAAGLKAVALDETLPEAHAALGAIAMYDDWDWAATEHEFHRALELNPNFAHARRDYAWFLALRGQKAEAIAEMKRAIEIDPLSALYTSELAWLYMGVGRIDDAVKSARDAVDLDPGNQFVQYTRVLVCGIKGLHDEAIAAAKQAAAINPRWKFVLALAYAKAGRGGEARAFAAEAARNPLPVTPFVLAQTYAALEQKNDALSWLEKGMQSRFSWMPWIKFDPAFSPLRGEPRFEAMVRQLKLPA